MAQPKLQKAETDSFYGDYLYANIVPENHFLRLLRDRVPWQRFTYRLIKYYRGKGKVGRPPIDPAILLKMLLLSYLYDLSERQVEEFCNYFLPAKYFLGLAIDAHAPDHSTLTLFKNRILENGKVVAYERLLDEVIAIAREAGIEFGPLQLVDSTHTIADVDLAQEKQRKDDGRGLQKRGKKGQAIESRMGEMLFTHFGIGGPITLLMSLAVVDALEEGPVSVSIDLKPALTEQMLRVRLQRDFDTFGKRGFRNLLAGLLPRKMVDPCIETTGIHAERPGHQISAGERERLLGFLKSLRFNIRGSLPMTSAMVTAGGVSLREIDPRTIDRKSVV